MSIAPNRMSGRSMNEAAWRGRADIAERILAHLAEKPCTVGRLIHDLQIPTSAATVLLGKLSTDRRVERLTFQSSRFAVAQEARAA